MLRIPDTSTALRGFIVILQYYRRFIPNCSELLAPLTKRLRMFVISKKSGGFRPFFNLRSLNQIVECPHSKMENIQQVIKLINRDDFYTSQRKLNLHFAGLLKRTTISLFAMIVYYSVQATSG
ncbi:hypothetical protein K450DRAFT_263862 [Umbelopsis ramanniana AG]|uniref:Uncharacterized protein n=1 Tax=Umbelopsis ramanniana AG TaxID=1314678 RepID=A0AAD5E1D4_UMBRA|nr:uncharacterized protein K450DRAFT_263862 [Umbelopsis ramanniana AG]KAI8574992.1 hypothetical protein K450DRAFT_263862 [Umbelopsis ramanniana AG]